MCIVLYIGSKKAESAEVLASRQKKLVKSYIMESGELLELLFSRRRSILWISGIKEQTEKGLRIICLSFRLIIVLEQHILYEQNRADIFLLILPMVSSGLFP